MDASKRHGDPEGKARAALIAWFNANGVNVTSTKGKSALSIIEDSPLRC